RCRLEHARMRALDPGEAGGARFGLVIIHAAILALDRGDHRQHQRRAELAREPGEDARAQTGTVTAGAFTDFRELLAPQRGVLFFDCGEAAIDFAHLRGLFALGQRAIERGAVELVLQIAAVTFGFVLIGHGVDPSISPAYDQREKETRA